MDQKADKILWHDFQTDISGIALPVRFTFPFYYEPHTLSRIAAAELQEKLHQMVDLDHNFGLNENQTGLVIGKMFGVLVVRDQEGRLGYLAAFSGKLGGANHHKGFVPPVYDILAEDGFFLKEEEKLNRLTKEIEELEASTEYNTLKISVQEMELEMNAVLQLKKAEMKKAKEIRDLKRAEASSNMSQEEFKVLFEELKRESLKYQWEFNELRSKCESELNQIREELKKWESAIEKVRLERRNRSSALQQKLFNEYYFLNRSGEKKSLGAIFSQTASQQPPAGAGECAAPKLLHYAFRHGLEPVGLAEFWWGASPKSEVRVHKQFYPACKGKCEPILSHMLSGIETDPNPMDINPAEGKTIEIVYEDNDIVVIAKPHEFLSVPGKKITDSVYSRMKDRYPDATGPLIVHRLDMSTSGLMVLALSKAVHKRLQSQFLRRSVKKQYIALLEGEVSGEGGKIELPLRVDLDDRPRQLVCYEHGRSAVTEWKVLDRKEGKTRVQFIPVTGRTHQLRVHSAHVNGLNMPILGDDLYGTRSDRLHLHASYLEFQHPGTKQIVSFQLSPEF